MKTMSIILLTLIVELSSSSSLSKSQSLSSVSNPSVQSVNKTTVSPLIKKLETQLLIYENHIADLESKLAHHQRDRWEN